MRCYPAAPTAGGSPRSRLRRICRVHAMRCSSLGGNVWRDTRGHAVSRRRKTVATARVGAGSKATGPGRQYPMQDRLLESCFDQARLDVESRMAVGLLRGSWMRYRQGRRTYRPCWTAPTVRSGKPASSKSRHVKTFTIGIHNRAIRGRFQADARLPAGDAGAHGGMHGGRGRVRAPRRSLLLAITRGLMEKNRMHPANRSGSCA